MTVKNPALPVSFAVAALTLGGARPGTPVPGPVIAAAGALPGCAKEQAQEHPG